MNKKSIYFIIVISILFVAIFVFVGWKKPNKDHLDDGDLPRTDDFPLQVGSKGRRVEQLQLWLKAKHGAQFSRYGIDGSFGPETLGYVKEALVAQSVPEAIFRQNRMSDFRTKKFI